jgi:hypothetical protein
MTAAIEESAVEIQSQKTYCHKDEQGNGKGAGRQKRGVGLGASFFVLCSQAEPHVSNRL